MLSDFDLCIPCEDLEYKVARSLKYECSILVPEDYNGRYNPGCGMIGIGNG